MSSLLMLAASGCGDDPEAACDPPCREGFVCRDDRCVEPSTVGQPCAMDADCGAGSFCNTDVPGGLCFQTCRGDLLPGREARCPAGAVCTQLGGSGTPICLPSCRAVPCRQGYVCTLSDAGDAICLPACAGDADCPRGRACDLQSGACVAPRASGGIGARCQSAADCPGGLCIPPAEGIPGGLCTVRCETAACPDGTRCVTVTGANGEAPLDYCAVSCTISAECRSDFYCGVEATPSRGPVCIPRCQSDAICPTDQRCDRATGICVPRETSPVAVEFRDLGRVRVGGEAPSPPLSIDVPADAQSFHVVTAARDPSRLEAVVPFLIEGPGGQVVYDFRRPQDSFFKVLPGIGRAQLLFPNAPRLTLRPGAYRITLASDAPRPTAHEVHALIKRSAAPPTGGRLDVNLLFVGSRALDAERARASPAFRRMLEAFRQALAAAGVTLGAVRYVDASPADGQRFARVNATDPAELEALFGLLDTYTTGDQTIDFIFNEALEGGQRGFVILGVAAGIPGPAPWPGRIRRGVAVTTADFDRNVETYTGTMVHEAGHYLGLFHTSERDGRSHDPLLDTSECRPSRDRDGDGIVTGEECGGAGAENVMFWESRGARTNLSREQIWVIQRNPSIR